MGLFDAVTIGTGALMGAGVYVLIGLAAGVAGPSVWLSYVICGLLAFFTTLLYAELARIVPVSGGGYAYAYHALGSVGGFVAGWFLALGSVFACGLYAIGFAEYFASLLGYKVPPIGVRAFAIGLVLLSSWINTRGTKGGDRIQKILTWGNLGVLVVFLLFSVFKAQPQLVQPMFPEGFGGTMGAIAIIYISFFGYQFIANNADEIKEPERTIPRAMLISMAISFAFYLAVALVAVMVIPCSELAKSNAPLIDVANISMGRFGWLFISVGGVLAAAGALNSTLLSQGRQIYAMGKDGFLPAALGKIHEARKTPYAALVIGGLLVMGVLAALNLEFIAQSANFCLLISLLPVSPALRQIYRKYPEKRPRSLFKRMLPELTLLINIGLLFTLDWMALLFGLQLSIAGAAVYFFYARKGEYRSRSGMNIVLSEEKKSLLDFGTRILVPMSNPQTQRAILSVSNALLRQAENGEIVALTVVDTPEQMSFFDALSNAGSAVELIERSAQLAKMSEVSIKPIIRASHNIPKGIVHAAETEGCDLVVMGYGGDNSEKSLALMEEVLNNTATDVIFLRTHDSEENKGDFSPKKIAVSLGGRNRNLGLMAELAGALATYHKGEVTLLHIVPPDFSKAQIDTAKKIVMEALEEFNVAALFSVRVLASDDALTCLSNVSNEYDLLVVGTVKTGFFQKAMVGRFSSRLAERAHCAVAVVHDLRGVRKIMRRM